MCNLRSRCAGILCAAVLGMFLSLPVRAIANDVEFAAARAAIENLLSRYLHGIDFRDPDMFAATFTADGVLNHGRGITRGHEALREFIRGEITNDKARASAAGRNRLAPPRHVISNILIDLHGDSAEVRDYWVYYTTGDDGQPQVSMYGNSLNEVVKQNGEWLIQRRIVFNEHAEGRQSGVLKVE